MNDMRQEDIKFALEFTHTLEANLFKIMMMLLDEGQQLRVRYGDRPFDVTVEIRDDSDPSYNKDYYLHKNLLASIVNDGADAYEMIRWNEAEPYTLLNLTRRTD